MDIVALDSTLKAGLLAAVYLRDSTLSWKDISDCGLEIAHVEDIATSQREVAEADCLGSGLGVDHYMMDRRVDTDDFVKKYFAVDLLVLSAAATISSWVVRVTVAAEILSMISFVEAVGMVSRMALVPDVAGGFDFSIGNLSCDCTIAVLVRYVRETDFSTLPDPSSLLLETSSDQLFPTLSV